MSDQNHAPTSRSKPPPPGEEEASAVLKLGEFDNVDTLTLSEASLVINALMTKRKKDRKDRNETEVLNKTLDYLDAFARFKQKENVEAVERLLSAHKELTKFERAQIGEFGFSPRNSAQGFWRVVADGLGLQARFVATRRTNARR
jgi:DNA-directed RNA polymerase II subunit RPB4